MPHPQCHPSGQCSSPEERTQPPRDTKEASCTDPWHDHGTQYFETKPCPSFLGRVGGTRCKRRGLGKIPRQLWTEIRRAVLELALPAAVLAIIPTLYKPTGHAHRIRSTPYMCSYASRLGTQPSLFVFFLPSFRPPPAQQQLQQHAIDWKATLDVTTLSCPLPAPFLPGPFSQHRRREGGRRHFPERHTAP